MVLPKICCFVILTILQSFIAFTFADKVVLDLNSDAAGWLDITCLYTDDYNDFWVFGYPVNLPKEDDRYPAIKGFWTPGGASRCEMHYYGGREMPQAKSITVEMYVNGTPQILVSSKPSLESEEYQEIGIIPVREREGWIQETIDLTNVNRAWVLNFTLYSLGDDLLLLNKIELDLGDDTTTPTEPPSTTSYKPIDKNKTVILDTNKDYWTVWEEDCVYMDDYVYYWAFGCPAEPKVESLETIGYWSPCNMTKSCKLRFKSNSELLMDTPGSIRMWMYLDGGTSINVTIQSNHDAEFCKTNCTLLGVISDPNSDNWFGYTLPQNVVAKEYTINIELIPKEGGTVLLDKVQLLQGIDWQSTTPGTTTTPTRTSTNPGTSSASGSVVELAVICLLVMASILTTYL